MTLDLIKYIIQTELVQLGLTSLSKKVEDLCTDALPSIVTVVNNQGQAIQDLTQRLDALMENKQNA